MKTLTKFITTILIQTISSKWINNREIPKVSMTEKQIIKINLNSTSQEYQEIRIKDQIKALELNYTKFMDNGIKEVLNFPKTFDNCLPENLTQTSKGEVGFFCSNKEKLKYFIKFSNPNFFSIFNLTKEIEKKKLGFKGENCEKIFSIFEGNRHLIGCSDSQKSYFINHVEFSKEDISIDISNKILITEEQDFDFSEKTFKTSIIDGVDSVVYNVFLNWKKDEENKLKFNILSVGYHTKNKLFQTPVLYNESTPLNINSDFDNFVDMKADNSHLHLFLTKKQNFYIVTCYVKKEYLVCKETILIEKFENIEEIKNLKIAFFEEEMHSKEPVKVFDGDNFGDAGFFAVYNSSKNQEMSYYVFDKGILQTFQKKITMNEEKLKQLKGNFSKISGLKVEENLVIITGKGQKDDKNLIAIWNIFEENSKETPNLYIKELEEEYVYFTTLEKTLEEYSNYYVNYDMFSSKYINFFSKSGSLTSFDLEQPSIKISANEDFSYTSYLIKIEQFDNSIWSTKSSSLQTVKDVDRISVPLKEQIKIISFNNKENLIYFNPPYRGNSVDVELKFKNLENNDYKGEIDIKHVQVKGDKLNFEILQNKNLEKMRFLNNDYLVVKEKKSPYFRIYRCNTNEKYWKNEVKCSSMISFLGGQESDIIDTEFIKLEKILNIALYSKEDKMMVVWSFRVKEDGAIIEYGKFSKSNIILESGKFKKGDFYFVYRNKQDLAQNTVNELSLVYLLIGNKDVEYNEIEIKYEELSKNNVRLNITSIEEVSTEFLKNKKNIYITTKCPFILVLKIDLNSKLEEGYYMSQRVYLNMKSEDSTDTLILTSYNKWMNFLTKKIEKGQYNYKSISLTTSTSKEKFEMGFQLERYGNYNEDFYMGILKEVYDIKGICIEFSEDCFAIFTGLTTSGDTILSLMLVKPDADPNRVIYRILKLEEKYKYMIEDFTLDEKILLVNLKNQEDKDKTNSIYYIFLEKFPLIDLKFGEGLKDFEGNLNFTLIYKPLLSQKTEHIEDNRLELYKPREEIEFTNPEEKLNVFEKNKINLNEYLGIKGMISEIEYKKSYKEIHDYNRIIPKLELEEKRESFIFRCFEKKYSRGKVSMIIKSEKSKVFIITQNSKNVTIFILSEENKGECEVDSIEVNGIYVSGIWNGKSLVVITNTYSNPEEEGLIYITNIYLAEGMKKWQLISKILKYGVFEEARKFNLKLAGEKKDKYILSFDKYSKTMGMTSLKIYVFQIINNSPDKVYEHSAYYAGDLASYKKSRSGWISKKNKLIYYATYENYNKLFIKYYILREDDEFSQLESVKSERIKLFLQDDTIRGTSELSKYSVRIATDEEISEDYTFRFILTSEINYQSYYFVFQLNDLDELSKDKLNLHILKTPPIEKFKLFHSQKYNKVHAIQLKGDFFSLINGEPNSSASDASRLAVTFKLGISEIEQKNIKPIFIHKVFGKDKIYTFIVEEKNLKLEKYYASDYSTEFSSIKYEEYKIHSNFYFEITRPDLVNLDNSVFTLKGTSYKVKKDVKLEEIFVKEKHAKEGRIIIIALGCLFLLCIVFVFIGVCRNYLKKEADFTYIVDMNDPTLSEIEDLSLKKSLSLNSFNDDDF